MVRAAKGTEDCIRVYSGVLAACDHPVILHWPGAIFDLALAGYWGMRGIVFFSANSWWKTDPGEVLDMRVERFRRSC